MACHNSVEKQANVSMNLPLMDTNKRNSVREMQILRNRSEPDLRCDSFAYAQDEVWNGKSCSDIHHDGDQSCWLAKD